MAGLWKALIGPDTSVWEKLGLWFFVALMVWVAYCLVLLVIGIPLVEAADRHGWQTVVVWLVIVLAGIAIYLTHRH
jgi:uncharacterized membrane protein